MSRLEIEELAAYLCGVDYDNIEESDLESLLYDKFNITIESLHDLVAHLLPMIDMWEIKGFGYAPDRIFKGFCRQEKEGNVCIVRTEC